MWILLSRLRSQSLVRVFAFVLIFSNLISHSLMAEKLTNDGREKRDLVFIDADTLVYVDQIGDRQIALMKMDLTTKVSERLHPDTTQNEFGPCYSPDGTHFAFLQNIGNLNLRLIIRNLETDSEAEFKEGGFSGMRSPTFTVDGQHVIYAYPEDGRQHIWRCDLKCENRVRLVDSSGSNNWPRATPDGRSIVFGSSRDGNYELYIADIDGQNTRRLTDSRTLDIRPCVSSEGKQIAFTSNRDGNYEIYRLHLGNGTVTRVTDNPERDDYPAWHPKGGIAYVAEEKGRFDIHLVPLKP